MMAIRESFGKHRAKCVTGTLRSYYAHRITISFQYNARRDVDMYVSCLLAEKRDDQVCHFRELLVFN